MTTRRRTASVIFHKDGDPVSRTFRIPLWTLRLGTIVGITIGAFLVLGAVLYTPLVRTAARVPGLVHDVEQLTAENQQVLEVIARLEYVEDRYEQIRSMLGGDLVPELQRPEGALTTARPQYARAPGAPACYEAGASIPRHWPLGQPGVVTRGPVGAGSSEEVHAGLDIAVAQRTPIRAAGGGVVSGVGDDPEYGLFVRIDHPEGYQTMYGHASRLLVSLGDSVHAGHVVGLSGTTGRSTAPHLHFEVRRDGQPIDPSALVSLECTHGDILVRGG